MITIIVMELNTRSAAADGVQTAKGVLKLEISLMMSAGIALIIALIGDRIYVTMHEHI